MEENVDIRSLGALIESKSGFITDLVHGMGQVIVGQKHLVDSLLVCLLSDGHILLEGVPGLAKTLAIKTLAHLVDGSYKRIQFTPDLLPADIVGTVIYSQKTENFVSRKGPIFANFILACSCQSTECFVGSHAGASGDHQYRDLSSSCSFSGNGYTEPN